MEQRKSGLFALVPVAGLLGVVSLGSMTVLNPSYDAAIAKWDTRIRSAWHQVWRGDDAGLAARPASTIPMRDLHGQPVPDMQQMLGDFGASRS